MGTSEWTEALGLLKATAKERFKTLPNLKPFERLDFQGNLGILLTPLSDTQEPKPHHVWIVKQ